MPHSFFIFVSANRPEPRWRRDDWRVGRVVLSGREDPPVPGNARYCPVIIWRLWWTQSTLDIFKWIHHHHSQLIIIITTRGRDTFLLWKSRRKIIKIKLQPSRFSKINQRSKHTVLCFVSVLILLVHKWNYSLDNDNTLMTLLRTYITSKIYYTSHRIILTMLHYSNSDYWLVYDFFFIRQNSCLWNDFVLQEKLVIPFP